MRGHGLRPEPWGTQQEKKACGDEKEGERKSFRKDGTCVKAKKEGEKIQLTSNANLVLRWDK